MNQPVSGDASDPFIQLDKLIPVLSELYTSIKSRDDVCHPKMQALLDNLYQITDNRPDAAIAAIHLSRQQSPLKQPIYGAVLAHLFSQQHGLDEKKKTALMQAVLCCNITFYEFQVLLNSMNSPLTDAQRTKLQKHPLQGAQLMEMAGFSDPNVTKAIRQHHERPDGSGYPNHLLAKDISELALVVSMCEVYTARIDNRAYRKPILAREALVHLNNDEDPRLKGLLLSFAKAIGLYPPGTWVTLANKETAIVTKRQKNSPVPIVKALFDSSGAPYLGPIPRNCTEPDYKVVGATSPPSRPSVDLPALFD